jgi:hypothetical protein
MNESHGEETKKQTGGKRGKLEISGNKGRRNVNGREKTRCRKVNALLMILFVYWVWQTPDFYVSEITRRGQMP